MTAEEKVQSDLVNKFKFLENKVRVQRARRIFAEVEYGNFSEVFNYAVKTLEFNALLTISGLDEGSVFGIYYHIEHKSGVILNIKTSVPKENHVLNTITGYFPSADAYERELVDLFGMNVKGLKEGKRYPLPDDWPQGQYPLRKDWKPNEK